MKTKSIIRRLAIVTISIGVLLSTSCIWNAKDNNIIADVSNSNHIIAVVGLGSDGKFRMFNSQTGEEIEDNCTTRKTTEDPCRATAKRDKKGNIMLRNGLPIMIDANGKERKVYASESIRITYFEGSFCVSGESAGVEMQSCAHQTSWPPNPFAR